MFRVTGLKIISAGNGQVFFQCLEHVYVVVLERLIRCSVLRHKLLRSDLPCIAEVMSVHQTGSRRRCLAKAHYQNYDDRKIHCRQHYTLPGNTCVHLRHERQRLEPFLYTPV